MSGRACPSFAASFKKGEANKPISERDMISLNTGGVEHRQFRAVAHTACTFHGEIMRHNRREGALMSSNRVSERRAVILAARASSDRIRARREAGRAMSQMSDLTHERKRTLARPRGGEAGEWRRGGVGFEI